MNKLEFGETAVLDDGKEYVCFSAINENGNDYVYLVTNTKPIEVCFAKQQINNGNLELVIVEDQAEKEHLLELFKEKMGK